MTQLYARVFVQILDSSIAEDYRVRYVFEDFLKICEHKTGIVDMTREALSRRLNIPRELLDHAITVLEAPDANSRDRDFDGRRIERLDPRREWGWRILNWGKYDEIRTRADATMRVARYRERLEENAAARDMAEKVYTLYPRKVGKPSAIKAIIRASKETDFPVLCEKTEAYSKACIGKDPQYIPHPATWFNQQRYNDDPATWGNGGWHEARPQAQARKTRFQ